MMPVISRGWILCCLVACATVAHAESTNPPPTKAFSTYGAYELRPVELDKADAATKGKDKPAARIQEHFDGLVAPIIETWKAKPAAQGAPRLVIEPRIDEVRKIGGATRFFAGALAGDSHITMHVRFVEQPGDAVIAEPEFYQRAAAMSGAWTVGAQDNDMLRRIAQLIADYLRSNYDSAVGGRTGREE